MKNRFFKTAQTFAFSFISLLLIAQENSISPIFSVLENSNGSNLNILGSVNQVSGAIFNIDTFSNENIIGNNFTVTTLSNSNVDKLYVLNANNNFSVYELPFFFDPKYNGEKAELVFANNITDFDYHHNSSLIYAYDLVGKNLYAINPFSGNIQSALNIPFNSDEENFSIKTTNNYIVMCGKDNGEIKIIFHDLSTSIDSEIVLSNTYKSISMVSNHELADLYAIVTDNNDKNWLLKINPSSESVLVVGALPSCVNCATESYFFDKNAISLDWENEQLLFILNIKINNQDHFSLNTVDLATANTVYESPLSKRISNLYFNKASSDLVFPGDTNHDGVVNALDAFSIGLKYSYQTIARYTQSTEWIGQHSFNTGVIKQGADIKHADCNGDGQINDIDFQVIKKNYSYIHNSNKSAEISDASCPYPLSFSFPTIAYENNEARINIKLGDVSNPVGNVYGVSFTLNYDTNFVVANTMHTEAFDSWFGIDGGTFSRVDFDDYALGKIDITLIGLNLTDRTGGGDIITAVWIIEDDVMPIANNTADMHLSISDITIIDYAEDIKESCGEDTVLVVQNKKFVGITTVNNNKIEIFPNPAKDFIYIESEEKINSIDLISITGKTVKSYLFNKNPLDIKEISSGVYFLKLNTDDGIYLEKIIID